MEVIKGRMYDYNNGRFLSVDPFIQSPTSTQSMNPYTYIFNNPLSGVDPSGYCSTSDSVKDCGSGLKAGESEDITNSDGKSVGTVTAGKDGSRAFTSVSGKTGAKINNAALNSGVTSTGVKIIDTKKISEIGSESINKSKLRKFGEGLKEFVTNPEHILNTGKKTLDFATSDGNIEAMKIGAELAIPIPILKLGKYAPSAFKSFANWVKGLRLFNKTKVVINNKSAGHIFKKESGHFAKDTVANRKILENVANNSKNLRGKDSFGNQWFSKTNSNGSQVWARVRNGKITNGGINKTPKTFNSSTGLSAIAKPKQ